MTRHRFAIILPAFFVVLTLLLWFWSRSQYESFVHSSLHTHASAVEWQEVSWTDYTPFPLEVAEALNVPVATFVAPLYALVHRETSTWTLFTTLVAIAIQWFWVGSAWDRRTRPSNTLRARFVAVIGILFSAFLVFVSIPMFHVGLIYKGAAIIWAFSISWHFAKVFRKRTSSTTPVGG